MANNLFLYSNMYQDIYKNELQKLIKNVGKVKKGLHTLLRYLIKQNFYNVIN